MRVVVALQEVECKAVQDKSCITVLCSTGGEQKWLSCNPLSHLAA